MRQTSPLKPGVIIAVIAILVAMVTPVPAQTGWTAMESLRIAPDGSMARSHASLGAGEQFLLKAVGAVKIGTDRMDAEYGGFGPIATGQDSLRGRDVGVEVYPEALTEMMMLTRRRWFGGYRPDHTYYMLVNGTGNPLRLQLMGGNSMKAASGAITVSLFRLSPASSALPMPLETLQVPVQERAVPTTLTTRPAAVYLLQASGSGRVGGGGLGQGDAEYMDYVADGTGAEDIGDAHTDYGLGVDEADQSRSPRLRKWGAWRKDHTYFMLFSGTGRPIRFFFYDVKGGYGDNSPTDALTVKLLSVP